MAGVYYIWALLPLALMFFGVRSYVRVQLKQGPREDPKDYFSQAGFCWLALFVSVAIDKFGFDSVVDYITLGSIDAGFLRWLIFPAMLLLLALAQAHHKQSKEEKEKAAKKRKRPNYAR